MRLVLFLVAAALWAGEARFAVGTGELRYFYAAAPAPAPLVVVLPGSLDEPSVRSLFERWQPLTAARGWNLATPFIAGVSDQAAKALELTLADMKKRVPGVDASRVYVAGPGAGAAEVFYALSREPDLWAAGLAIQGDPAAAINSFKLFGANTGQAPLLWIAPAAQMDLYKRKLTAAGFHFEARSEIEPAQVFDWLGEHQQAPFPATIDCETGNPTFARCYWIEMTKFDPRKRNDVLKSTRVLPGSGASLSIGPFGYDQSAEGPGALVGWLPPDYHGPLKLGDRLVSLAGKEIGDGRDYAQQMDQTVEEKPVAVVALRGKERVRIVAKIVLPTREEVITARVEGKYSPADGELYIISRAVTQLRLRIPAEWTPVKVSWNGLDALKAEAAGCWTLSFDKDAPEAGPCP